jgi:DMSO/TMAO reductase YedYZ heme-binding membrane subunit
MHEPNGLPNRVLAGWIVAALLASTLVFYTSVREGAPVPSRAQLAAICSWADPARTRGELLKASALVALGLLSLSLVGGPLQRWRPSPRVRALVRERKRLGLAACAFAAAHVALALGTWRTLATALVRPDWLRLGGLTAAAMASFILFRMAVTSTRRAQASLGAVRWKRLHRWGAVALALSAVHFLCMEIDPVRGLRVRPYGLVVLASAVAALAVRGLARVFAARSVLRSTALRSTAYARATTAIASPRTR